MRKLLPPYLFLGLGSLMAAMAWLAPIAQTTNSWLRVPGVVVAAGGLAATVVSNRRFARIGTNIMTFNDPDVLVSTGLFRHTRNPMYLGFAVALVGLALAFGALTSGLGPLAFFIAADRWYIPFEEDRMAETFGADYVEYAGRVPRWIGIQ